MTTRTKPPTWFWVVAGLLVLWGLAGCYACVQQFRLGADAMGPSTPYQRALYGALPGWYNRVYALAVGAALAGALLLLARSCWAELLFGVSLAAVVVQFGWLFVATDIIAEMGVATAAGFPIVIAAITLFSLWLARRARRRGWIG